MSLPGFTARQSLYTAWGATRAGGKPIREGRRATTVKVSIVPQYHGCMAGYCLVDCGGQLRCIPDRCSNGYCYCVPPPGCVIA
jgi:hypothetical protein